jgi:hypothetical protein
MGKGKGIQNRQNSDLSTVQQVAHAALRPGLVVCILPPMLLTGCCNAIGLGAGCCRGRRLRSSLGDDVGLVNGALDNLLFFRIEVLGKVLVKRGLFLLKFYEVLKMILGGGSQP